MTWSKFSTLALLPLGLAGCMEGGPGPHNVAGIVEARVVGEPQNCVPINQLHESRIRDDSTIDFMRGRLKAWRVSLAVPCPGLRSENKFSYETSLSQLCSTDIIHVLHDYGGRIERGPGCGLSQFVRVELSR
ncbi:MAG: hypothetical protein ABIT04_08255 [Novosphingobium sp.]